MNWNDCIERTNTHSVKWSFPAEDVIPMCIADMDFQVSPAIVEAMNRKAQHGIYGYTTFSDRYFESVISWWKRRFQMGIEKEWISFSPGIIPGINVLLSVLTEPGDGVIIQDPVYYPFYSTIENHGCSVMKNTLLYEDGVYSIDFDDLEEKARHPRTKLLILCSPHNPVGRVWTREELMKIGSIAKRHGLWIISDEMHGDLVYKGYEHVPLFKGDESLVERSILCAAPSKTFNIAGLQTSILLIPNKDLRDKYNEKLTGYGLMRPNVFGIEGTIAAYEEGEPWLNELLMVLEENKQYVLNYLEQHLPELKGITPQATHLIWMDCTELGMAGEELCTFFLEKAKVKFDEGFKFGQSGHTFVRMNIACPKERIDLALRRIHEAILEYRVNRNVME
ncbi:MalY/PatB family protein [Rossellomorea aquimaris]|uniref:cysteine-S-conjugate beta-lyase n=1 Tax=Rossellomorea aquimaris TaxID=189382 RepID=A0A5D4TLS4_9BACI|nr:MalY/PatB family protein [Rossellomorea aquimaris]TYS76195.1 pyridoxal phosphate-dependent aminotransferase [Rossellomorea aquimaris]TYS82630.1 pyridoxal phosphate-dependent aminotransferase [Rossellomorea aquimaris]